MAVLAIRTPEDGLLGALAPLGLAAAAGTALVVDLDPLGPRYPSDGSLADLVAEGPRRTDLTPSRGGLAVLRNGGIEAGQAREVVDALAEGWPVVVVRMPARDRGTADVVVHPLVVGGLFPASPGAVFQDLGFRVAAPGPVLPPLSRTTAAALLAGTVPRRSRWVRAWMAIAGDAWA